MLSDKSLVINLEKNMDEIMLSCQTLQRHLGIFWKVVSFRFTHFTMIIVKVETDLYKLDSCF